MTSIHLGQHSWRQFLIFNPININISQRLKRLWESTFKKHLECWWFETIWDLAHIWNKDGTYNYLLYDPTQRDHRGWERYGDDEQLWHCWPNYQELLAPRPHSSYSWWVPKDGRPGLLWLAAWRYHWASLAATWTIFNISFIHYLICLDNLFHCIICCIWIIF